MMQPVGATLQATQQVGNLYPYTQAQMLTVQIKGVQAWALATDQA
jgi:hypothetical protein